MQDFNAENWASSKEPVSFDPEPGKTEVRVSCSKPVEIRGIKPDGSSVLLHSGTSFRLVATFRSFSSVVLRGSGKTEFGYSILHDARQDGEPIDHRDPPAPPMPGADNLLLQVKRIIQNEMRANRPPVLEPEDLPFANRYMVDDDDERFEEELFASPANPDTATETPQESDTPPPDAPEARQPTGAPDPSPAPLN